MASDIDKINHFLQMQLAGQGMEFVGAVEAAQWLDQAGLLWDSTKRPGKPLRELLRSGMIAGRRQEPSGRWYIDRIGTNAGTPGRPDSPHGAVQAGSSEDRQVRRTDTKMPQRDEAYVIDLCDELLGQVALRQHRFEFLRGDAGTRLPVDAYYPALRLVIEYSEPQHTRPTPFFDKPHRLTVSGVNRAEQRALYDQRRRNELPRHGIDLLEIPYDELSHTTSGRLARDRSSDLRVLRSKLAEWLEQAKQPEY
jgi:hypothetical protein